MEDSMKNGFRGFYPPSKEEFELLWKDAIVCLDSSVLLNLYVYSKTTAEEILDLLEAYSDRLWIPHQVALEYHTNRCRTIEHEAGRYRKIVKDIEAVGRALEERRSHPHLATGLVEKFSLIQSEISVSLSKSESEQSNLISDDFILDKVTELFDQRVGRAWGEDDLSQVFKEGKLRFQRRIPPGYKDEAKPEPSRYGDLVLWKQILAHAKNEQRSLLFVTDDIKEDWWAFAGSRRVGPRPELRQEFESETGHQWYAYTTDQFVETVKNQGQAFSSEAEKEVEEVAEMRNVSALAKDVRERQDLWARMKEDAVRQERLRQQFERLQSPIANLSENLRQQQDAIDRIFRNPVSDFLEEQKKRQEMFENIGKFPAAFRDIESEAQDDEADE